MPVMLDKFLVFCAISGTGGQIILGVYATKNPGRMDETLYWSLLVAASVVFVLGWAYLGWHVVRWSWPKVRGAWRWLRRDDAFDALRGDIAELKSKSTSPVEQVPAIVKELAATMTAEFDPDTCIGRIKVHNDGERTSSFSLEVQYVSRVFEYFSWNTRQDQPASHLPFFLGWRDSNTRWMELQPGQEGVAAVCLVGTPAKLVSGTPEDPLSRAFLTRRKDPQARRTLSLMGLGKNWTLQVSGDVHIDMKVALLPMDTTDGLSKVEEFEINEADPNPPLRVPLYGAADDVDDTGELVLPGLTTRRFYLSPFQVKKKK